ncbi:hypothetical protein L6452_30053 [Arctium lappa]|uniref:Uncharacterized protein n=1 Tax=Arctium lappa TaxID=4217 RepID=A0ACB8ZHS6_ARCLA|nr:hypothetical protein L6452_30053 [Arctium lappa]
MAESAADALENINMENEDCAETEGLSVPLSNPSNVASVSSAPSGVDILKATTVDKHPTDMEGMEATMERLLALIDDTYKYVDDIVGGRVAPDYNVGRLQRWKITTLEDYNVGRLQRWKITTLEDLYQKA